MQKSVPFVVLALLSCSLFGNRMNAAPVDASWDQRIKDASILQRDGEYVEAKDVLLGALEQVQGFQEKDLRRAITYNNLASVYQGLGRYADAENLYRRAIYSWKESAGDGSPALVQLRNNLVGLHLIEGHYAQAEQECDGVLFHDVETLGADHPEMARFYSNLAALYAAKKEYGKAEQLSKQALEIFRKSVGSDDPKVAVVFNDLAVLDVRRGRFVEAGDYLQDAVAIWEKARSKHHVGLVKPLANLGSVYYLMGRLKTADLIFRRALSIGENGLGKTHPLIADVLVGYAPLLREMRRTNEAKGAEERADEIYRKHAEENFLDETVDVTGRLSSGSETGSDNE